MKKVILTIALTALVSLSFAQPKVTKDANGNYIQVKAAKDSTTAVNTGKTFTDLKGNVYPVMETKKGKLYIVRVSKTSGKSYNQYLK